MHIKIENIDQFNHYFHQPTYHPQVSVGRLQDADLTLFDPIDFGMYCVVLMEVDFGELVLRDTCMRYRGGTMFTMKPGDVVSMHLDPHVKPHGWMLAFRPEQLNGTGLGRDFYLFNFFDYKVAEALELYDTERKAIINCFHNINTELQSPDDDLTSHMLRLEIAQMLTFCRRFYDRQFDTFEMRSSDLAKRFDRMVDEYFSSNAEQLRTMESSKRSMVCRAIPPYAQLFRRFDKKRDEHHSTSIPAGQANRKGEVYACRRIIDNQRHRSRSRLHLSEPLCPFVPAKVGQSPTAFRRQLFR